MLEPCIHLEPGILEYEEQALFDSDEPLWLLGTSYDTRCSVDSVKADVSSRLWFTYRKNFPSIGGTGPSSDQGWGCMLRCGQMVLAHCLLVHHIGRDWRWLKDKGNAEKRSTYLTILRMFQDKKDRLYSLHQIAQMGASEGRSVGSWFGPNTVSQVLRRLAAYDDWSRLAVHVAMDSLLIDTDVRMTVRRRVQLANGRARSRESSTSAQSPVEEGAIAATAGTSCSASADSDAPSDTDVWCPLLILLPLRLGLTSFNICYIEALEACFKMRQCAGLVGGRPNHALYFLGCCGTELIYLDPHQCQDFVDMDVPECELDDSSYHCPFLLHMDVRHCDPSVALAFFCDTPAQYADMLHTLKTAVLPLSSPSMFEVVRDRPGYMPQWDPYPVGNASPPIADYAVLESTHDTDDEFEVLDVKA